MANAALKALAGQAISLLPGKLAIIRSGASLPPSLRNARTVEFLSAVAARCACPPADLDTNLGIHRRLQVSIPLSKPWLLFGAPRLFVGERSSLDLALALFRHSGCFLDIGSNVGLFVFYLRYRDSSSSPIYFFEPNSTLFSQLERNITRNEIHDVKGFQVAIAEKAGRTIFYRNKTDDSSGSLVKEDWSQNLLEAVEIDQTSFGDFASKHNLENTCVKVDVEGAEELFFDGAKSSLSKLTYLIFEDPRPGRQSRVAAEDHQGSEFSSLLHK